MNIRFTWEYPMLGSIIATLGAICIVTALTLVRYRHVSGNSHTFAILQAIGAAALALSTLWQYNIGTLILESYCVIINLHTLYLNMKRKKSA
jgi:hypothetical protein